MLDSDVLEALDFEITDPDGPQYAHYAEKSKVTEGYIMGTYVIALCGKMFIPSRDPLKLDICPICKDTKDGLFLGSE